jgi:hypothetical protein
MSLLDVKKKEIYNTLMRYGGNKTKAAAHLEMSIRSLRDLTNRDPMFYEFKNDDVDATKLRQPKKEQVMNEPQRFNHPAQVPQRNEEMPEVFNTKEVVTTLNSLMNRVTEKECTSETVNAACNCAHQITQLLRVHLDVERLKRRG